MRKETLEAQATVIELLEANEYRVRDSKVEEYTGGDTKAALVGVNIIIPFEDEEPEENPFRVR